MAKKLKTEELIQEARNFLESYKKEVGKTVKEGRNVILLNFDDIGSFSIDLADSLIEYPEEILQIFEVAMEESGLVKNPKARLIDLPNQYTIKIRDIRAKHLNKFIQIEGIIKQSSEVRPQVVNAKFECPSCGTILSILQIERKFREPSRCSCGRKAGFKLLSKDMVDAQRIVIEESPEELEGGEQPRRMQIFLKEDLVEPKMEGKTTPGSKVKIVGILKEVPILLPTGSIQTRFDLAIEANNIIPLEESFDNLEITDEDEKQIRELAADPKIMTRLVESIAPSIFGYEEMKKAVALQLFGGVKKERSDATKTRGDIHILLVGDPGVAKSVTLKFISGIAPRGRYVVGKSSTGAGLCVAPNSLIATNPGGIHEIQNIVEENLQNYAKPYQEGIWNSNNPKSDKKIFTLDKNLKMKTKEISQFWRINPPNEMIKIKTRLGKEIIVTPNTKLYNSKLDWKEAFSFKLGEYLATARNLNFEDNTEKILTVDLLKSNPVVLGVKDKVKFLIEKICEKKNWNKRILSQNLKVSEGNLYYNWINKKARGNIKLKALQQLSRFAEIPFQEVINEKTRFALYNGHIITLPKYLNEDLLYFAGLIAGDGDLSKGKHTVTVRFSSDSKELMQNFLTISKNLFDIKHNLSSIKSEKRPESWRFSSKLVFEILESLGIPASPKSHKIDMSNILLKLPRNLLAFFLRGYYDTDGGCVERKSRGGNYIESNSTSKIFSEKLKLILLRYGILAKLRERKVQTNEKVKSKYNKFVITIQGKENLEKFENAIGFDHLAKKQKLDRIIKKITKIDTNIDVIPHARELIEKIEKDFKIKIMNRRDKHGISRNYLLKIIQNLEKYNYEIVEKLKLIANADIFWDKIVLIEKIKNHGYDFVYDLTIEDSHSFIVNGILVHNTATVVRDDFMKGWSLEAGAMVLSNRGVICIDELEKMDADDRSSMHEAMEQGSVTISKANILATLRAETSVLAAANPKFGRFDPYQPISQQIDLPPSLLNRFDVIFTIRDMPDRAKDEAIATHVLSEHRQKGVGASIDPILLRKYIAYARQKIKPVLTEEAMYEIKKFYVDLRNMPVGGDALVKPIPISARQLEALIRLGEAHAKIRLSNKLSKEDALSVIELMKYYLMQVGYDYESKTFDIDKLITGVTTSQRNKVIILRDTISKMESRLGKLIPLEELRKELSEKMSEKEIDESLEKLAISGDVFYPRKGYVQKV